jgi:hypothetical protein
MVDEPDASALRAALDVLRTHGRVHPKADELLRGLSLAEKQIDSFEGGRLGWLVGFAREDSAGWMPADTEGHGYRLLAFAGLGGALSGGGAWANSDLLATGESIGPKEVLDLHSAVFKKLQEMVDPSTDFVAIPAGKGLETGLACFRNVDGKRSEFHVVQRGPWRARFWNRFVDAVTKTDRLMACPAPKCGRPFLALRKKKFCTPKCAERWHDQAKVEKKRKGGLS